MSIAGDAMQLSIWYSVRLRMLTFVLQHQKPAPRCHGQRTREPRIILYDVSVVKAQLSFAHS